MATPTIHALDLAPVERLRARLRRITDPAPHVGPLMASFMKIIDDDNRKGVLAGTDCHGGYMLAVTYRPVGKAARLTRAQKGTTDPRARRGRFRGLGLYASGIHNNLTSAEYRRLGGPPLAPRKAFSRVITNLKTGFQRIAPSAWEAYGYWDQVVSTRGVPFLHAHFTGAATGRGHRVRLPVRDLRGVRPEGMALATKAAGNWGRDLIRSA